MAFPPFFGGGFRLGPDAGAWILDYTTGTFTRTAQAIAQTGAPTDGSTPFVQTFGANVRAFENMGDGAGSILRIEGARTNYMNARDWVTLAYWTAGIAAMIANAGPGIDGTAVADECNATLGQYGNYVVAGTAGGTYVISQYQRAKTGTSSARLFNGKSPAVPGNANVDERTLTTIYQRLSATHAYAPAEIPVLIPFYGFDSTGYGFGGPIAGDLYGDYSQFEVATFPSSPIFTNSVLGVTRDADTLTFTTGQVDATLFTGRAKFMQISPEFANTDLLSGDILWLWAIDSSNGVRIRHNGATVKVEAVAGGVVRASSNALAFVRNALLGAVQWNPVTGVVTVNGTPGPTGTAWTWTPGTIRIGGIPSGTGEAFCRFGTMQSA